MPKPRTTRYLRQSMPGHPLADGTGCVRVHRAVLWTKVGPGAQTCHWCSRRLLWFARGIERVVADHLNGDRWDNRPENLVPSCRTCNSERSTRSDFLTHCSRGHRWTDESTYSRPDGTGRMCRPCAAEREGRRPRRQRDAA